MAIFVLMPYNDGMVKYPRRNMYPTSVRAAQFVLPTRVTEVHQVKRARFQRTVFLPIELLCKITGTVQLAMSKSALDARQWDTPPLHNILYKLLNGFELIRPFYTFSFLVGNMYFIETDEELAKAVLSPPRHGQIFRNSITSACFMDLLKMIYPEIQFQDNDFMATCDAKESREYRSALIQALNAQKIAESRDKLQEIATQTVVEWFQCQKEEGFDASALTRIYAARTSAELLFHKNIANQEFAESVNFINAYIVEKFTAPYRMNNRAKAAKCCKIIRDGIDSILEDETLSLFKNIKITPEQKKAYVFLILFAGQETTAALLTHILWKLASDQTLQDEVYTALSMGKQSEKVKCIFINFLREFTPAYINLREVGANPVILNCVLADGKEISQVFFPGDKIFIAPYKLASKFSYQNNKNHHAGYPFGGGPHVCPGSGLALAETEELVAAILENYELSTAQQKVTTRGEFTLGFPEPVFVRMRSRNKAAEE
jgi:cytochrome P450